MKHLCATFLLLAPVAVSSQACRGAAPAERIELHTLTLSITGMTCALNCPPRVKAALESVPGVVVAAIDYDARRALVRCPRGTDPEELILAVRRQGFGAALAETP